MRIAAALRNLWRQIFTPRGEVAVDPEYSYRIFWTKQALNWSHQKREEIHQAVVRIIENDEFEANNYLRRYKLESFEGQEHAGASLVVLHDVLQQIDQIERSGGLE